MRAVRAVRMSELECRERFLFVHIHSFCIYECIYFVYFKKYILRASKGV